MARMRGIAERVEQLLGQAVVATTPVAGGDICTSTRVRLSDGSSALVKTRPDAPTDFFEAEARGLRWLAEPGAVDVAEVLAVEHDCLVLRWIEPGATHPRERRRASAGRWPGCTRAAPTSSAPSEDGFIGSLPLPEQDRADVAGVLRHPAGAALPQARLRPRPRRARGRRAPSRR